MDSEARKQLLRKIGYGLYVATASSDEEAAAAAVSWVSQVSFEPCLVMVAIRTDSTLNRVVQKASGLAINLISASQKDLAASFFRSARVEGGTINGHAFESGLETGAPILSDLPGWLELKVVQIFQPGDHTLYLTQVVGAGMRDASATPLLLPETGWSYGG